MKENRFPRLIPILLLLTILSSLLIAGCSTGTAVKDQVISAEQAQLMIDEGAFLLDVRTPEEYAQGHIPGSVLIPLDTLASRANELPQDQPIVVYCRSGNRSLQAVYLLEEAGFDRVHSMDLGINQWIAEGYEVIQ